MAGLLLRGYVLGFAVAASPGPLFFLCLRRTLARGWRNGVVSGLGVATADGVYGALAAFGVAAVTAALVSQRRWLTLIGGVALVLLGLRALRGGPTREARPGTDSPRLAAAYLSTLALTLTNPSTILAFVAVFASLGLNGRGGSPRQAIALVVGVLLGSATWWLVLATLASLLRARVTPAVVQGVRVAAALAILTFGVVAVASSVVSG
jgi:threonine/homoserine/homoserine lactone efflux protein